MEQTTAPRGGPLGAERALRETARIIGQWWLWLLTGIAWGVIALAILQFDAASITTVGVRGSDVHLRGGTELRARRRAGIHTVWVSALFGALFLVAAVICFVSPANTFAALADSLGFLFLLIGLWWIVRAFLERAISPLWWLGLASGILMTILAFWTGGQFFVDKAYVLLVFAGIWALMASINDIVRAFVMLSAHQEL